ncbi:MAG: beta-ketoacyl-ACP synthase III [Algiphilus sp.]
MVQTVVIGGTGLYTPEQKISNEELVESFNTYVALYNEEHAEAIAAGTVQPLQPSSAEFIEKASGIRSRYVLDREGILDPKRMRPRLPTRANDEPSFMCEMGVVACREALQQAGVGFDGVDGIIVACSNMQRPYPAIAVELQAALGIEGWGYDMNVACASAAFGIQAAADAVRNGSARAVLVVSPEICSGHLNFCDRDSHFIFGDAATAVLVSAADGPPGEGQFEVLGTRLRTVFSNNIRNNRGFLNRSESPGRSEADRLFVQNGRRVFKDVVPMVSELISTHLRDLGIEPHSVRRFYLHQANLAMNEYIARRVLGRDATADDAPVILDEYANTSSAGSVIAFHKHRDDIQRDDIVVLSGFGAGYSAGCVVMRKH